MQSKVLAGVSGLAGLAVLGFIANQVGPNNRARRAIVTIDKLGEEDPYFVENADDITEGDGSLAELAAKYTDGSDVEQKALPKRFRENQVVGLHDQMLEEWEARKGKLQDFLDLSRINVGVRDPSEFGSTYGDEGQRTYNYDQTTEKIEGIISDLKCNNNRQRSTYTVGGTNFWFLFPQAIPLHSETAEGHIGEYSGFFDFVRAFSRTWDQGRNIKFTVGRWGRIKNLFFPPNPIKVGNQQRLVRVMDFVGRRYQKPSMTVAQPAFSYSIQRLIADVPRKGTTNSRSAGENCYVFMFFADVPTDLSNFYNPDENVATLEDMCTVIPFVVGDFGNGAENAHRMIAALFPNHQKYIADDADYAAWFHLPNMAALADARFVEHVSNYICMHQARTLCRIRQTSWEAPPSDEPDLGEYYGDYVEPTVADNDEYAVYEPASDAEEEYEYAMREATEGPEEESAAEIDRCCGSDYFTATPYESKIKACCDDGRTVAYVDGNTDSDPCLGIGTGSYEYYGDYYK